MNRTISTIDKNILSARFSIELLQNMVMKTKSRKPPRPGLFWYEPTHRWRKKPEAGGSFSKKELNEHVEKTLSSLQSSIKEIISNPFTKGSQPEFVEIMTPIIGNISHALEGKNTYAEILNAIQTANGIHYSPAFEEVRNEFWKLHELVHEGSQNVQSLGHMLDTMTSIGFGYDTILKDMNKYLPNQWPTNKEDISDIVHQQFGEYDYNTQIKKTLDNASIFIAIRDNSLERKLNNGFKASVEVGKGTFAFNGWERYEDKEKPLFGLPERDKLDPKNMPKYGFLASKNKMDNVSILNWGYGNTFIQLKDNLKERTTFTNGNSYSGHQLYQHNDITPPISIETPDSDITMLSLLRNKGGKYEFNERNYSAWKKNPTWQNMIGVKIDDEHAKKYKSPDPASAYIEAQIFGELNPEHIEAIHLESKAFSKQVETMLNDLGHTHIKIIPSEYDSRLIRWDINSIENDVWISDTDINRLGDSYIHKNINNAETQLTDKKNISNFSNDINSILAPYRGKDTLDKKTISDTLREFVKNPDNLEYLLERVKDNKIPVLPNPYSSSEYSSDFDKYLKYDKQAEKWRKTMQKKAQVRAGMKEIKDMPIDTKRELLKLLIKGGETQSGVPDQFYMRNAAILDLDDVYNQEMLNDLPK